jgi:predicted GNAT family N-acyltransferase
MQPVPAFHVRQAHWPQDASALRSVRARVFIAEQGVPEHLEWDGKDAQALHLLAETHDGLAIGTARLLPDGRLGRMAVLADYRGRGVGRALFEQALLLARRQRLPVITLHAQIQVVPFYQRFGFERIGGVFLEAGISHQAMRLTVQ